MRHTISPLSLFWYYHARKVGAAAAAAVLTSALLASWLCWPALVFTARAATASSKGFSHPGGVISFLLIGRDYTYDAGAKSRSWQTGRGDTLLLVTLRVSDLAVNVLSIPRDIKVGPIKINEAGGAARLCRVVERVLGIPVHHHIEVGPEFIGALSTAVGGVTVLVESDMDYDDKAAGLHIHLKKGWQRLSGKEPEGYVRYRGDADADLGRVRRQRIFLAALLARLKRINPLQAPVVYQAVRPHIKTDLGENDLLVLGRWMAMGAKIGRTATLPVVPINIAYLRVDWPRAVPVIQGMLHYSREDLRRIRECPVQYVNVGNQTGVAKAYKLRHERLGLGTATHASDTTGPNRPPHSATIIYRDGMEDVAAFAARLFHQPTLRRGDVAGHAIRVEAKP